jgi:hypothetical protein
MSPTNFSKPAFSRQISSSEVQSSKALKALQKLKLQIDNPKPSIQQAFEDITSELQQAEMKVFQSPRGDFHLSFLFASPLMRECDNKILNVMQIDYLKEIKEIDNTLLESDLQLKYQI